MQTMPLAWQTAPPEVGRIYPYKRCLRATSSHVRKRADVCGRSVPYWRPRFQFWPQKTRRARRDLRALPAAVAGTLRESLRFERRACLWTLTKRFPLRSNDVKSFWRCPSTESMQRLKGRKKEYEEKTLTMGEEMQFLHRIYRTGPAILSSF